MAYEKFQLQRISAIKIFNALSEENRLRIIKLLAGCHISLCVWEMVEVLNLRQYLISKKLNILKKDGLGQCEKRRQSREEYRC